MSTIQRKARRLARRLRRLMPDAKIWLDHSYNVWGCSSYVYLTFKSVFEKLRISDHPVGERRLKYGEETVYLTAGFHMRELTLWLRDLMRHYRAEGGRHSTKELPLFKTGAGVLTHSEPGFQRPTLACRDMLSSRHPCKGGFIRT